MEVKGFYFFFFEKVNQFGVAIIFFWGFFLLTLALFNLNNPPVGSILQRNIDYNDLHNDIGVTKKNNHIKIKRFIII